MKITEEEIKDLLAIKERLSDHIEGLLWTARSAIEDDLGEPYEQDAFEEWAWYMRLLDGKIRIDFDEILTE